LTQGKPADDPVTTERRRTIILEKPSLRRIYTEWYGEILGRMPSDPGRVLELGSGAGFMKARMPNLITSDILRLTTIDVVTNAGTSPFRDTSLSCIVMTNVLHHLPDVGAFFEEASRCVRSSGAICLVEPWVSAWSKVAYTLHSEPFQPRAPDWTLPSGGPLSSGNGALAWILFHRDRSRFQSTFPEWELAEVSPILPFRYLVSGGVSMRQLAPSWAFGPLAAFERALQPLRGKLAMFAIILLRRV
jgi:SAM-dependent methyltransferase